MALLKKTKTEEVPEEVEGAPKKDPLAFLKETGADGEFYFERKKVMLFAVRTVPIAVGVFFLIGSLLMLSNARSGQDEDFEEVAEIIAEREEDADSAEEAFRQTYREMVDEFSTADVERMDSDIAAAQVRLDRELDPAEVGIDGDPSHVWDWDLVALDEAEYTYAAIVEVQDGDGDSVEAEDEVVGDEILSEQDAGQEQTVWALVYFTTSEPGVVSHFEAHWTQGDQITSWVEDEDDEDQT